MEIIEYRDIERVNEAIKTTTISKTDKRTGKTSNKEYAEVNQRIKAFRMLYPEGFIRTRLISNDADSDGRRVAIMLAEAGYYDSDEEREMVLATGMAYEKEGSSFINQTSYIENCETSAVGRALGMLGIGIDTSVASAEEVQNAMMQQTANEKLNKAELAAVKKAIENNGYKEDKICDFFQIKTLEEMNVGQLRQFNDMVEKNKKEAKK